MARNPYDSPRRREERIRRRHQEGVPQARTRVPPPTATPATTGAEERFKEVQGAYDVLPRTPRSAMAYDAFGEPGARGFPGGGADMGGMRFEEFDLGNLGDLARRDVRRRGRRAASRQPIRGNESRDARSDLVRGLAQGRAGARAGREVETACTVCHGTGAEPGTAPITCPQCGGRGVVSDSPGPLRNSPAVSAVSRQRHDHREALQAHCGGSDASA